MKPFFITCRNNVITTRDWTLRQKRVKLVDYRRFRTDLTRGGLVPNVTRLLRLVVCVIPLEVHGGAEAERREGEGK